MSTNLLFKSLLVLLAAAALADPALAAGSADWVAPATNLIESLESGLVKMGSAAVGVGVIIVGLVACITSRMEWSKFGYVVIGGLLIMTGPAALRALLETAQ
ncbi:hypothetical protein JCM17960_34960 [Magnetospira thiophila]